MLSRSTSHFRVSLEQFGQATVWMGVGIQGRCGAVLTNKRRGGLRIALRAMRTVEQRRQRDAGAASIATAKQGFECRVEIRAEEGIEQGVNERRGVSNDCQSVHSPFWNRFTHSHIQDGIEKANDKPEKPADGEN